MRSISRASAAVTAASATAVLVVGAALPASAAPRADEATGPVGPTTVVDSGAYTAYCDSWGEWGGVSYLERSGTADLRWELRVDAAGTKYRQLFIDRYKIYVEGGSHGNSANINVHTKWGGGKESYWSPDSMRQDNQWHDLGATLWAPEQTGSTYNDAVEFIFDYSGASDPNCWAGGDKPGHA